MNSKVFMSPSKSGTVDEEKEEQLLLALRNSGPLDKDQLKTTVDLDEETIRSVVRELLYTGRLSTTPDWKFEIPENED